MTFRTAPVSRKPPTINASYPFTYSTANPTWTTTGMSSTIESITNTSLYVPAMGQTMSFSVCLPAGYTAGSATYPVVINTHGAVAFPTTGPGVLGPAWPAAYHDAVSGGYVDPHITILPNLGEYSMGTNCPGGPVMIESFILALMLHVHATYRTKGTAAQFNALMGFSMGARSSLYWLFKYALLHYLGVAPWCWGGAAVFGPPVYAPGYDYANDSGLQDWALPCISPGGGYSAAEIAVWSTKCAQSHVSLPALSGKLIRVGYGNGDPVRTAAGTAWQTAMNSAGVTHEYVTGLLKDDGTNIQHNAGQYWGGLINATRPHYQAIQRVFTATV